MSARVQNRKGYEEGVSVREGQLPATLDDSDARRSAPCNIQLCRGRVRQTGK
jgi:hypothetical protein